MRVYVHCATDLVRVCVHVLEIVRVCVYCAIDLVRVCVHVLEILCVFVCMC